MQINIEKSRKLLSHPKIDKMTLIMIKPRVAILQKAVLFGTFATNALAQRKK